MDEKDYLYTIKVPFKAGDDILAREKARELSKRALPAIGLPEASEKLQRLVQGKPPEAVKDIGR
jgi:hypothetical protein